MFVLEQPQCALHPSRCHRIVTPTTAVVATPLSPTATPIVHPICGLTPPGGSGGSGGGSERAPFRGLWCVQMVVHREITRGCAQLYGYIECKTFGRPTPIRPMTLRATYDNGNVRCSMQPVRNRQWDTKGAQPAARLLPIANRMKHGILYVSRKNMGYRQLKSNSSEIESTSNFVCSLWLQVVQLWKTSRFITLRVCWCWRDCSFNEDIESLKLIRHLIFDIYTNIMLSNILFSHLFAWKTPCILINFRDTLKNKLCNVANLLYFIVFMDTTRSGVLKRNKSLIQKQIKMPKIKCLTCMQWHIKQTYIYLTNIYNISTCCTLWVFTSRSSVSYFRLA